MISVKPTRNIYYRRGYCVSRPYTVKTAIRPQTDVVTQFVHLYSDGTLIVLPGFFSDGASGYPDTPRVLRGAFLHDAKYWLMREGLISRDWKSVADVELEEDCVEDDMPHTVADIIEAAVLKYGDSSTRPGGGPSEYFAPGLEDKS